jgi:hypothetical protein
MSKRTDKRAAAREAANARLQAVAKWQREEGLRKAEVAYITDRQRRSVEYWWDQLCSEMLPLPAFLKRARAGRWTIRRDEYWAEVQAEVLRQSRFRAVHDRVAELQQIQQLRSDALELIQPRVVDGVKYYPIKPKSLEGMIGSFIKLDQLADAKRDAVLTMVEPELQRQQGDRDATSSQFSPEEIRRMTRMLLEERQQEQQQRLIAGGSRDGDEAADPQEGPGQEEREEGQAVSGAGADEAAGADERRE